MDKLTYSYVSIYTGLIIIIIYYISLIIEIYIEEDTNDMCGPLCRSGDSHAVVMHCTLYF